MKTHQDTRCRTFPDYNELSWVQRRVVMSGVWRQGIVVEFELKESWNSNSTEGRGHGTQTHSKNLNTTVSFFMWELRCGKGRGRRTALACWQKSVRKDSQWWDSEVVKPFRRRMSAFCQCRGWYTERGWDDVAATYPIPLAFPCFQADCLSPGRWEQFEASFLTADTTFRR